MLMDVDERSAVGSAGKAFKIHWENRFRKDGWLLPEIVVVTIGLSFITGSERNGSRRGVGGFNNVELPEDDLAWDLRGSSAWASRWIEPRL